jgi:glutamyl-tRNA synthetase
VLTRHLLVESADVLAGLDEWQPAAMEQALRGLAERHGIAAGRVFQPMRVALTGSTVSPGIFDVLAQLGRDLSVTRLRDAAALIV